MQERDLRWDGCLNVRDLGGLPTSDGHETRFGRIVRADNMRQLTDAGWEAAAAYGIRTIVDLRGEHELEADPPGAPPFEVVHVPFMEASADEWEEIAASVKADAGDSPDVETETRIFYVLALQRFSRNVAAAMRAVARAPEGGVVIHCVGGKDRTGLLAALVLELAGVGAEEIAADYALSEERLRPRTEAWLAAVDTEVERDRLRRGSYTPAASMLGVFAELARRYESVEGFLGAAGLSDEDQARARDRLRD